MLRVALEKVFEGYAQAKTEPFGDHPVANFIRDDLKAELESLLPKGSPFVVEGSPGKGRWAEGPWLAIFDPVVTDTAQKGYYPVFLFAGDLSAVYLSFNQGITMLKDELGVEAARAELLARGIMIRGRLKGRFESRFPLRTIALGAARPGSNLELYERGNAFAKRYERGQLPQDADLATDIQAMLDLYRELTVRGGIDEVERLDEGTEDTKKRYEEKLRKRLHERIEQQRNGKLAKEAKKHHGYVCQVCEFDFNVAYGDLGKTFIEAHHKVPLARLLEGGSAFLSPETDFAVVCANCHRMLHRRDAPTPFEAFVELFKARRLPGLTGGT